MRIDQSQNSHVTLALMMNVDWFQPYDCEQYSVGAIYLLVMNLPRSERFKRENVILFGLIPGPHEPSLSINSFLKPTCRRIENTMDWSKDI